jgi:hypothetical protein
MSAPVNGKDPTFLETAGPGQAFKERLIFF